jgi:hypothetical protein
MDRHVATLLAMTALGLSLRAKRCHCERSAAIHGPMDRHVATLLAMTAVGSSLRAKRRHCERSAVIASEAPSLRAKRGNPLPLWIATSLRAAR